MFVIHVHHLDLTRGGPTILDSSSMVLIGVFPHDDQREPLAVVSSLLGFVCILWYKQLEAPIWVHWFDYSDIIIPVQVIRYEYFQFWYKYPDMNILTWAFWYKHLGMSMLIWIFWYKYSDISTLMWIFRCEYVNWYKKSIMNNLT